MLEIKYNIEEERRNNKDEKELLLDNFEINFALNMEICNYSAFELEPKSDLESLRKNAIFGQFIWT